jgi:hypothetical protein
MPITFAYNNITIDPAPQISIKSEIVYANDSAIGYKYEITLNGTAINKDSMSFVSTISEVNAIRSTLSKNGSRLLVSNNGNQLLEAFGGVLLDLSFDSENSFSRYSNYRAVLSFNELNILDDAFSCNSSPIPTDSFSSHLLDINKYKIKEFKDNWTFNLGEGILNFNDDTSIPSGLKIYNTQLEVSYEISAEGLPYFDDTGLIVVPWQQAKGFVQDRLFNQIKNFHSKKLLNIDNNTCLASKKLNSIYDNSEQKSILGSGFPYSVYDETIECSTSEANGSFSAKYNAILKFDDISQFSDKTATHTFSKRINTNYDGTKEIVSISIEGTIQGLNTSKLSTDSDLIFGTFALPNNGKLLQSGNNIDKLNNAIKVKDKIIEKTEDDLTPAFKSGLAIIPSSGYFDIPSCSGSGLTPSSFSLTTNHFLGTINYSAEYTTDKALSYSSSSGTVIYNTSIDVEKPKKVYAELPIIYGDYVIQDLKTTTSQKINISVNGRRKHDACGQPNLQNIKGIMNEFTLPAPTGSGFILTNKNISYNFPNNSFTMNVSYLCKSGCSI